MGIVIDGLLHRNILNGLVGAVLIGTTFAHNEVVRRRFIGCETPSDAHDMSIESNRSC